MFGKSGAIRGGLDVEETYQLIDTYIQECERLSSMEAITALQYNMLIDFTSRVAENKIPEGISEDIYACTQFINNHTNEPIGINEVADHINRSRAYLTDKFKKETGKTVNEYILDKKLSESKSFLKHTNKSLSDISYFLCFSSQAYYQTLFKKKYGETPGAYRKRFNKI
jgi:AraC-like DNA-binding protein